MAEQSNLGKRRYFGTDGIRGKANSLPMTVDIAQKLGQAAGLYFKRCQRKRMVVLGKDTRLSGYMIECALVAGFLSAGMDVTLVGPLPTPAIALLTRSLRADLGVMISASHNPYTDNGIKLFGADGFKFSDAIEAEIESLMAQELSHLLASPSEIGKASRLTDAAGRYIENVKTSFPRGLRLDGLKIVLDCAHGSAYKVAPTALWELGAEIIKIGCAPDGVNINDKVGSTYPQTLQKAVLEHQADCGIALDGDADRVIFVDEKGAIIDGDQIIALIAASWQKKNLLKGTEIVTTIMSNMGLERYLEEKGLSLYRTSVGDRYVVERMRQTGGNLGGEQSGHMVLTDYGTTGDGLIAALQVLSVMVEEERKASDVCACFTPFPQRLENIRFEGESPLLSPKISDIVQKTEAQLKGKGRLVLRESGTEPLIRVMIEAEREEDVMKNLEEVCHAIRNVL